MNLLPLLARRVESAGPIRVGLIGSGKFGSMFLSQVPHIDGLAVTVIADLSVARAQDACRETGWPEELMNTCRFTDDAAWLCAHEEVDVVVEATGNPLAGASHALRAIEQGRHVVMVNVEADVLCGVALAEEARRAGVVYSMAYGDQPALIAEMVDWARAAGFNVAAAGKGTRYLPGYHQITPDDVWHHYGLSAPQAKAAGMNPQMFNSFLDGTKSAIEMAAVANACDLQVPPDGLQFPPCGVDDLPTVLRPQALGGVLSTRSGGTGQVEVVSSLERDARAVFRDLRWGVFVVLEAPNDYAAACFRQYGLQTDSTGRYAAQYKPYHLIGLELSISILSAVLRAEPTGVSRRFNADAVAVAKRDLVAGETLDGEGGYTVYGKLMRARDSISRDALPIGLAHQVRLVRPVSQGNILTHADIEPVTASDATRLRSRLVAGP